MHKEKIAIENIKFFVLIITIALVSCNSINKPIDLNAIQKDPSTDLYLYKDNGKIVTGTIIQNEKVLGELVTRKLQIKNGTPKRISDYDKDDKLIGECFLFNGKIEGMYKAYYPTGEIKAVFNWRNNKIDGILEGYDMEGKLIAEMNYVNDTLNGVAKYYNNGLQTREVLYEKGKEVKSYDFDSNGNKIIPVYECLELVKYESGFYEEVNNNSNQVLYVPMVILKLKNVSDKPLQDEIVITGIFTSNGEEWSSDGYYFQKSWKTSLQSGLSRQISIPSSVGLKYVWGIPNAKVSCQLLINGDNYKTIKIENKLLESNRIQ